VSELTLGCTSRAHKEPGFFVRQINWSVARSAHQKARWNAGVNFHHILNTTRPYETCQQQNRNFLATFIFLARTVRLTGAVKLQNHASTTMIIHQMTSSTVSKHNETPLTYDSRITLLYFPLIQKPDTVPRGSGSARTQERKEAMKWAKPS